MLNNMRALWKGTISFGLVTIPVSLFPATRREELKFHLLRRSDLSPINYKRIAEADGKEVPWDQIVKGYEYEKDQFVVLKEEDFARVDVEATQTVDIINFVKIDDVDPLLFYKPYYLEVGKGGDKAYVLLRESLAETSKIAIAKVVIRTQLIESMSSKWEPSQYSDEYHEALEKMIEKKIQSGGKSAPPPAKKKRFTNVVDLMSVLKQSLRERTGETKSEKAATKSRAKNRKKAA
jgi:DNA end-binding protein Ku